jgi:hypothetical protein
MKAGLVSGVLLALCLASPLTHAQEDQDEHAGHHPEAAAAEQATGSDAPAAGMERMQRNMKRIQGLMKKIHSTDDEAVREDLLKQHLQAMREQIAAMRAMADQKGMGMMGKGGGMAGGEEGGPRAESKRKEGMRGGMMRMHKQMENRAGMLEMLIEQMLEREAVQQGLSADGD